MPRLLLVRHGKKLNEGDNRFWGHADIPLNPAGRRQIERLRDRIGHIKTAAIYASDLGRAMATADILRGGRSITVTACPELREVDFGQLEGLTFDEISRRYPEIASGLGRWQMPPAFPGGESLAGFDARVRRFLARLEAAGHDGAVIVAAHGGSIRLLVCQLLSLPLAYWGRFRCDPASLTVVDTYPENEEVILSTLNDTSHLDNPEVFP